MDNNILVINSGSSSVKFGLYALANNSCLINEPCPKEPCPKEPCHKELCPKEQWKGSVEGFGSTSALNIKFEYAFELEQRFDIKQVLITEFKKTECASIENTHEFLARYLSKYAHQLNISKVCYRVVHGGHIFSAPVIINAEVLSQLQSLVALAPLHQPLAMNAIHIFMAAFPNADHVACFDTAFHRTMPREAQTFALPGFLTDQGIRPYGFHGLSFQYVVSKINRELRLNDITPSIPKRLAIAHLGSGASLCAVLEGKSIATTMTFSPLDGLPMSTRCGSIDPAAVLYMTTKLKLSEDEVLDILNNQSGLLGISGISGDIRVLLDNKSEDAQFAINYFVYRICQALAGMVSALQGIDALVFTGGAGANSSQLREKIIDCCQWLGISIDPALNRENNFLISDVASDVRVYSVKTDEEWMMAQLVLETETETQKLSALENIKNRPAV